MRKTEPAESLLPRPLTPGHAPRVNSALSRLAGSPGFAPALPGLRRSPGARRSARNAAVPPPTWPAAWRRSNRSPGTAATTRGTPCRSLQGGEGQRDGLLPSGADEWIGEGDAGQHPLAPRHPGPRVGTTETRPRSKGGARRIREPRAGSTEPLPSPPSPRAHCFRAGLAPVPGRAQCEYSHGPYRLQPGSGSLRGRKV